MKNKKFYILAATLILLSGLFWIYMFQGTNAKTTDTSSVQPFEDIVELTMYHGPGCECCVKWADYLEDQGVTVHKKMIDDPHDVKDEQGIPTELRSCHTGIVDGYVVEGHVPVEDIQRMLREKPDVIGISAPGMPPNSPGMDLPVDKPYQTVLFDGEKMTVYNTHR